MGILRIIDLPMELLCEHADCLLVYLPSMYNFQYRLQFCIQFKSQQE